jgi:hypothetical protein
MKKYMLIVSLFLIAILSLALRSIDQEPNKSTYVTVTHSTQFREINIYYGTTKIQETIKLNKGENRHDKIVDTLNKLSDEGYELVSSNTHIFNVGQVGGGVTEFIYTLRKK